MELLNKRELRKICRNFGMGKREFNKLYKSIYNETEVQKHRKAAVIGTTAALSLIPSVALADDPPPIVEKVKEEKRSIDFLTGTYYQALLGNSFFRLEAGSKNLPLGLEAYGLLDLESESKKPEFEKFSGDLRLTKNICKNLKLSERSTVASGMKDVMRLGLKYLPKMKNGDVLTVEFYPIENDGKQTLYVYGMKKLANGKFSVDLTYKGTFDDFSFKKYFCEIGCGATVAKGIEAVAQGRFGTGGYRAFVVGARYSL